MGTRFNAMYLSCPVENDKHEIVVNSVIVVVKIMGHCGESFNRLAFGTDDGHLFFDYITLKSIAEACHNLEMFDFRTGQTTQTVSWIEAFGRRMRKLKIDSGIDRDIMLSILLHCTHIRELTL